MSGYMFPYLGYGAATDPNAQVGGQPPPIDPTQQSAPIYQAATANVPASTMVEAVALLDVAASGAAAYHGYMRTKSIGWAIAWGLLGGMFPVITIPVAIAQGFGKPKRA